MLRTVVTVGLVLTSAGMGVAVQLPHPVRTEPPVPRGTGATLVVTAPEALCREDLELMVTRTIIGGHKYVFQAPVRPPVCHWVVEEATPGEYQAHLQMARGDQRIVAMSQFQVIVGVTSSVTIQPLAATIEGLISVAGIPVAGAHVEVKPNGAPAWAWETRTDETGFYKVTAMALQDMCVRVRLPDSINPLPAGQCRDIGSGSNRQDLDAPPGRVQIELVPRDGPILETPVLLAMNSPARGLSTGVTVTGRALVAFAGLTPGKVTVKATSMDYRQTFDVTEVVLTPDEPVRSVTLSVPYTR
jgi:hypothetical protein